MQKNPDGLQGLQMAQEAIFRDSNSLKEEGFSKTTHTHADTQIHTQSIIDQPWEGGEGREDGAVVSPRRR